MKYESTKPLFICQQQNKATIHGGQKWQQIIAARCRRHGSDLHASCGESSDLVFRLKQQLNLPWRWTYHMFGQDNNIKKQKKKQAPKMKLQRKGLLITTKQSHHTWWPKVTTNNISLHVVDVMALIYMHLVASHQIWFSD